MEMTTVSPSPALPTEGDDLCEIDVTNVAIHSVTLLICLCGLVGNGAVLRLLSLKVRNTDFFDLAFTDFLFLLFTVPSIVLFLVEDVSCSPIISVPYLSFLFQLSVFSYYWVLFRVSRFSRIMNIYLVFKRCCLCDLPKRLRQLVFSLQYWMLFALLTVIPEVSYLCPSHEQGHCRLALISLYALILLLFAASMVITIRIRLLVARRGSKELKPKRRDIVFFLIVLFIFLLMLYNVLQQLGYIVVPAQVLLLLNCIHSSIKPFIYFLAGGFRRPCSLRSLQLSLQRVFDEQKDEAAHSNDAPMDTVV